MSIEMLTAAVKTMFQLGTLLFLSPLLIIALKKFKANLQGRQGPPWLQGYYDLLKYFRKETVISREVSWLFLTTPALVFACVCTAGLSTPTFMAGPLLPALGGLILLVYLLGLGRFFTACAAMEPGSGFCGMASSREMMLASLVEPVMLLALFVIGLIAGSSDFFDIVNIMSARGASWFSPPYFMALAALFIVSFAEMGRIPFDNPETHYELTMIHEGMLLEYSGKELGLMLWSSWIKQLIILSMLANLIFPWGLGQFTASWEFLWAICIYLLKLLVLGMIVALIETVVAKVRLFRVKDLMGIAFALGMIALILTFYVGG